MKNNKELQLIIILFLSFIVYIKAVNGAAITLEVNNQLSIYSPNGEYTSIPHDTGYPQVHYCELLWDATVGGEHSLVLQIDTGNTGFSGAYTSSPSIIEAPNLRPGTIKWKASMTTSNSLTTPKLNYVTIKYTNDGDIGQEDCDCSVINNPLCQSTSCWVNSQCCGDDSGEFKKYFEVKSFGNDILDSNSIGKSSDMMDETCCSNSDECVLSGTCYALRSALDLDSDGIPGEFCDVDGLWNDCDTSQSDCESTYCNSLTWIRGGESSTIFGEFQDSSSTECCGDDLGEYLVYWAQLGTSACCDNSNDCVDTNGNCQGNNAETNNLCSDGIDNDCDGLVDCDDFGCMCGTPGSGNTYCNGNLFDSIATSVVSSDYCANAGCLDTPASGHSGSDVKCGNSGAGEFGICHDDGSTNECKKLDSTNFQKLAESGYSCPSDQEFKFGDTIELDLQFDHAGDAEVNNWNYLIECNYDESNEYVTSWSQGSNLVNINFPLSNPVYDAQAFNPINLGIECKVWTDYYDKNGWEVDTMSFNVIVTPSCSDECVIGGVVYKDGDNNSANTCETCDVSNHQFNWTEKPDGGTCFGNPAGPSDRGLCCANKCTTPTLGGFYTDDSVTDSTDGAGLGLGQSCIVGRRVGQIKCFGDELMCDGLECSDNDNTDGMWNKDGDVYFENAAGQCDNNSDCTSNLQGCSQNSCRCENLATCTIPGDSNVYFDGDINSANPCQICNTSRSVYNWSYMSVGETCGQWKCSNNILTYTEDIGGVFAVKGMCRDTGTEIRCEDVYEAFCADSDLTDYGKGTQVKACSAQCDSPNDENLVTGEACDCSTLVDGKCVSPCTWGEKCDGVRILNTAFYCGKQDYVCPEDFYDPTSGISPMCTGAGILPECADPDC